MANPIPVTISPPAAAAAGCGATCLPWYHHVVDAPGQQFVDYWVYQLSATAAAGWTFDHFEWTLRNNDDRGGVYDEQYSRGNNPFPQGSPRYITYTQVGEYGHPGDYSHGTWNIINAVAVFTRQAPQVPLLVRDDVTGKLVYDDVTSGKLINGM